MPRKTILATILLAMLTTDSGTRRVDAQTNCDTNLSCYCECAGEVCDTCCTQGYCWIRPVGACLWGNCVMGGIIWNTYTMDTDEPNTCKYVCCVHEYATCVWEEEW